MGFLQEGNSGQTPRTNSKAGAKITPGERGWEPLRETDHGS
jgi:hypothetical protein